MKRSRIKDIAIIGVLTAIDVVLSRFVSVNAWNMKFGTGFIPVIVAAILYGPVIAGLVGAMGDFIGAILVPMGPYFPGFTATAFAVGLVFGFFLHSKKDLKGRNYLSVVFAVIIDQFVLSQFVNTFWISIVYKAPYGVLFLQRLVQSSVMTVIELILIPVIFNLINRFGKGLRSQ